ncbi:MAG: two pore domain potassium channel family protein [Cytophagales bacterium]|nr:two pore domain potassium channel family protein [Cytophagales bacterium]
MKNPNIDSFLNSTIRKFLDSVPIKRIGIVLLFGIIAYIVLTLFFAALFLMTDSITKSNSNSVNFLDCFYFSCVTFLTIGYGDIVPKLGIGQLFVFFESVCSLAFTPLFGGFLAYRLLQRPKDLLLTENFFLRYRNDKIFFRSELEIKEKK